MKSLGGDWPQGEDFEVVWFVNGHSLLSFVDLV